MHSVRAQALLCWIFVCVALASGLAQAQEVPARFQSFPQSSVCEAWGQSISGAETLAGTVQVNLDFSGSPLVKVSSKVEALNFSFGQRIAAGRDRSASNDHCDSFFDDSERKQTFRYFCSSTGETSWMSSDYSSITYSPGAGTYSSLCLRGSYRNAQKRIYGCWTLKRCK